MKLQYSYKRVKIITSVLHLCTYIVKKTVIKLDISEIHFSFTTGKIWDQKKTRSIESRDLERLDMKK